MPTLNADALTRRALFKLHEVKARKKQRQSAYDVKIRLLENLLKRLTTSEAMSQGELFDQSFELTPECHQALHDEVD